MSGRLLSAPARAALVVRESGRGFALLIAAAGLLYGLYAVAGNGIDDWMDVAVRLVVVLAPLVVVASFAQSAAGGDDLWLQKPVDAVRFHLARFLEVAVVGAVSAILFRCAGVAVGLAAGWRPDAHPLQPLPVDALTAVVLVAVGFGLSCWWRDHGRLATSVYLAVSLLVLLQLDLLRTGSQDGAWSGLLRFATFPLGARRAVGWFLAGQADFDWRPIAWLLSYVAAWLVVGVMGIRLAPALRTK